MDIQDATSEVLIELPVAIYEITTGAGAQRAQHVDRSRPPPPPPKKPGEDSDGLGSMDEGIMVKATLLGLLGDLG